MPALLEGGGLLVPTEEEEAVRLKWSRVKEVGEDEDIHDDDSSAKCKRSVKRAKTSDRTIVPTDVKG